MLTVFQQSEETLVPLVSRMSTHRWIIKAAVLRQSTENVERDTIVELFSCVLHYSFDINNSAIVELRKGS